MPLIWGGGVAEAAGADSARLARYAGQDLEWVQPSWWRPTWELRAGGDTLFALEPVSWWRGMLVAELDGERIVFGRSLWHDTAVRERDGAEVARLHRARWRRDEDAERLGVSAWWGTGRIDVAGERAWLKRTPWSSRWTLLDERGRELASLACRHFGLFVRGDMRIATGAKERPGLALLTTFAWWVIARERGRQSRAV